MIFPTKTAELAGDSFYYYDDFDVCYFEIVIDIVVSKFCKRRPPEFKSTIIPNALCESVRY